MRATALVRVGLPLVLVGSIAPVSPAQTGGVGAEGQGSDAAHATAPRARAAPLTGTITLDGRLDEAGWASAPAITAFAQLDPSEGEPVSEPTEVRIAYDAGGLYVGARLRDSGPVS